ncbi:MAG: hypothetical protein FJZ00_08660, partial [Candidatus Sericytochromatia bacterium]|nr:hypothetical protein [Candidatus Tanganyikabacteria bacterium]
PSRTPSFVKTPSPEQIEAMKKATQQAQNKQPIKTGPSPSSKPTPTRPPIVVPSALPNASALATVLVYEILAGGATKLVRTITKTVPQMPPT